LTAKSQKRKLVLSKFENIGVGYVKMDYEGFKDQPADEYEKSEKNIEAAVNLE